MQDEQKPIDQVKDSELPKDPNATEVSPYHIQLATQWAETHGRQRPPLYRGEDGKSVWINRRRRKAEAASARREAKHVDPNLKPLEGEERTLAILKSAVQKELTGQVFNGREYRAVKALAKLRESPEQADRDKAQALTDKVLESIPQTEAQADPSGAIRAEARRAERRQRREEQARTKAEKRAAHKAACEARMNEKKQAQATETTSETPTA